MYWKMSKSCPVDELIELYFNQYQKALKSAQDAAIFHKDLMKLYPVRKDLNPHLTYASWSHFDNMSVARKSFRIYNKLTQYRSVWMK